MATLSSIVEDKLARLESVPDAFVSSVDKSQRQILKELLGLMDGLDREGGAIITSNANLVKVEQIGNKLREVVFETDYRKAVATFGGEFQKQAKVNNSFFNKAFGDVFSEEKMYETTLKTAQKNAIELFADAGINQNFVNPARDILQSSVSSGQSFGDAVKAMTDYVIGTDKAEGTLLRYVKQSASDAFSFADRQYTKVIAEDLGVEWYHYVGGLIKDSRCFCEERNGKYYHKKEVEAWGNKKDLGKCNTGQAWAGMAKGTTSSTIFTFAGGYFCQHSILPVSISVVPDEVVDRNKKNGNYVEE